MEYSYRILAGGFQCPRVGRIEALDVWDALDRIRVLDMPLRIKHATVLIAWPVWDKEADAFRISQQEFTLAIIEGRECWGRKGVDYVHRNDNGL